MLLVILPLLLFLGGRGASPRKRVAPYGRDDFTGTLWRGLLRIALTEERLTLLALILAIPEEWTAGPVAGNWSANRLIFSVYLWAKGRGPEKLGHKTACSGDPVPILPPADGWSKAPHSNSYRGLSSYNPNAEVFGLSNASLVSSLHPMESNLI